MLPRIGVWPCCRETPSNIQAEHVSAGCALAPKSFDEELPRDLRKASTSRWDPDVLKTRSQWNVAELTIGDFAQTLKAGGSPIDAPGAESNGEFLDMLDTCFPELAYYRTGKVYASPGVSEIDGSPTEYYRAVGSIIAIIAAYLTVSGDEDGLTWATAGDRGVFSMDRVPGRFINMGNKPMDYSDFCYGFAELMRTDKDWWGMIVLLVVHDVGKSEDFRAKVNSALPEERRSDDHDRVLANALGDPDLTRDLLPSVYALGRDYSQRIAEGFATNFQLPQLGQGETSVHGLRGLLELDHERVVDGTLHLYLYHSIFDIAGASSSEKCIFPLALQPVYIGYTSAMRILLHSLREPTKTNAHDLYFEFLYRNFRKAYPEFERETFGYLCESRMFRHKVGLVLLRVLAMTRNTYKNPTALLDCLSDQYTTLVGEMSGKVYGPQLMLYYGPDMLRMGLGADLEDESGENIGHALGAMEDLHRVARKILPDLECYQFDLNVSPVVQRIKAAGKDWRGGVQLRSLCQGVTISHNANLTEGIVVLSS